MTSSSRTDGTAVAATDNDDQQKSNIIVRAIIFISLHLAFVGAGVLIYSG